MQVPKVPFAIRPYAIVRHTLNLLNMYPTLSTITGCLQNKWDLIWLNATETRTVQVATESSIDALLHIINLEKGAWRALVW